MWPAILASIAILNGYQDQQESERSQKLIFQNEVQNAKNKAKARIDQLNQLIGNLTATAGSFNVDPNSGSVQAVNDRNKNQSADELRTQFSDLKLQGKIIDMNNDNSKRRFLVNSLLTFGAFSNSSRSQSSNNNNNYNNLVNKNYA